MTKQEILIELREIEQRLASMSDSAYRRRSYVENSAYANAAHMVKSLCEKAGA